LRGSGYIEGTLFPWVVSDFSLMDAIECGIVKLPRVPVSDNIPGGEMPTFRNLWDNIRNKMPKKGRGNASNSLDPLSLPSNLQTALQALYGHYEKTFNSWQEEGHRFAAGVYHCLQQHGHLQAGLRLRLWLSPDG
jgi:type III restriction enzyme